MKRIPLYQLLALIAVVALGLAAIRSGSLVAVRVSFLLTISVLLTAVLGALLHARPFGAWLGFALFGVVWSVPTIIMIFYFDVTEVMYVHEIAERVHPQLPRPAGFPSGFDPSSLVVYNPEVYGVPNFAAHAWALKARRVRVENSAAVILLLNSLVMGLVGSIVGRVLEARCGVARP